MGSRQIADKVSSWQAPSFLEDGSKRQGWVEEACVQEGEAWQQGQIAYQDIPKAMNIISGKIGEDANQKRSSLNINHAKFSIRKIVSTLADVREVGIYKSEVTYHAKQAAMFNKAAKGLALEGEFPWKLRQALQWMSITAKGYLWPMYERLPGQEGRLNFEPLGFCSVLPVQLPEDNDIQKAYSVTLIRFMPVYMAHGKFPAFQHLLKPIARRRYTSSISARRLDLAERFKYGEMSGENWANLYCEIRYTFINDLSINPFKDQEIPMGEFLPDGEPATTWSYKVPYIGQEIPTLDGRTKAAEPEDCMIYPNRRLIITSKSLPRPMYDGPAKDLHGMVPAAEYCCDDWVTEPGGFSLVHDIYSIERARQALERGVDQIAKARLDPSLGYDRSQGLNDQTALTIDPFEERGRVGVDGKVRDVIDALLPEWLLNVPGWGPEFIKYLNEKEDAQLGLNELQNLADFKATLQSDNAIEKALAPVGPLVRDIGACMQRSTARVWEMLKFIIPQCFTTKRLVQYTGLDGLSPETFDYDPEQIIPSHALEEFHNMPPNLVTGNKSKFPLSYRSKQFSRNLRLIVIPGNYLEVTQTQEQMKWLQLYRGGFPLAPHDVAKKLNIQGYGEIEGDTYWDRYLKFQEIQLEAKARLAQIMQSLFPQGEPGGGEAGTGPKGGQKGTGGRAPSGGQAPKIKQKTGASGPRTTVSESG